MLSRNTSGMTGFYPIDDPVLEPSDFEGADA